MTQWILTSSLLIVAVLLIRKIAGDRLSARVRYALWGLVLLRLLIPVSIGESALSVQNWLPNGQETAQTVVQRPQNYAPVIGMPTVPDVTAQADQTVETNQTTETIQTTQINQTSKPDQAPVQTAPAVQPCSVHWIAAVWGIGAAVVGGVLLVSNLHFALRLRRSRRYLMRETVDVYVTTAVETPCLFGVLRPAIYITPGLQGGEAALRHVLAHELTHYRHGDHIWSLLRCLCVSLHWYNPLVWVAAFVSQKDAEFACDEGTLRRMGDGERTAYARTLLELTCVHNRGILTAATSMAGSESDLKNRVIRIVKNPAMTVTALIVVIMLAALAAVMLFSGAPNHELEQVWRTEVSDASVTELEFSDGMVRMMGYSDGKATYSMTYPYTVDGNRIIIDDYSIDETIYIWDEKAGTLTHTNPLTELTTVLYPYKRTDNGLLGEGFVELRYVLAGQWVVDFDWNGGSTTMMDAIRSSKIEGRTTELPDFYEYELHYTCDGQERVCYIAENRLWIDGTGYALSKMPLILQELQYMRCYSNDPLTDSAGRTYYLMPQPNISEVYMWYGENRYYIFDKADALAAAVEAAVQYAVTEIPELPMEEHDHAIAVELDDDGSRVMIWPNGTVFDQTTDRYILPEHTAEICALVEEYRWMMDDFAIASALYGSWQLLGAEDVTVYMLSAGNGFGTVSTYTVNQRRFDQFDLEVNGESLVFTYADGSQKTYRFAVDGSRMTLTGEDETLELENLQQTMYASYWESFDVIRRRSGISEPLLLSEAQKRALSEMIRAGIPDEETDENIIYSDEMVFDLLCLEIEGITSNVVLSDRGKIFYDGKNYLLTNAREVLDYLNGLYAQMDGYTLENVSITHTGHVKTHELIMVVGEGCHFWPMLQPSGVYVMEPFAWSISDAAVAEVVPYYDETVVVNAKKPGTVTLTLRCGELTDTAVIHVIKAW